MVLLAILHNATPVGFLAERFGATPRGRPVLAACAALFVAVPTAIACGWVSRALSAGGITPPDRAFDSAGTLADHLRVFVPSAFEQASFAPNLFAACAYLQLLHYGVVIGVLPRLLGARGTASDAPIAPWPRRTTLTLAIAGLGMLAAVGFVRDFVGTRAAYGLLASVHAWIELPVLLLALAPRPVARAG